MKNSIFIISLYLLVVKVEANNIVQMAGTEIIPPLESSTPNKIDDTVMSTYKLQKQQQQLDKQRLLLSQLPKLKDKKNVKSASLTTCLTAPLPNTPRTPNYSLTYTDSQGTAELKFWREPCRIGTGSVLLVKATPKISSPFFCGAAFKIIQNSVQLNDILLNSSSDIIDSFCDDLLIGSTLIIEPLQLFNPVQALTILYSPIGGTRKSLAIPAAGLPNLRINGSAVGYKSYKFTCKNTKTGAIKSFASRTAATWNCNGLVIKSGDAVVTTITGIVK